MSVRSLNKVLLIGNLTRDPELRYTPAGTAVCTFGLATNRSWVPSDGSERQEETEYHRIVAWSKLAEICAQILAKGRKVYVEGRIQNRKWQTQEGQERETTEIVIDNMIALSPMKSVTSGYEQGEYEAGTTYEAPAAPAPVVNNAAAPVVADDEVAPLNVVDSAVADDEEKTAKKATKKSQATEEVSADDIPF